MRIGIAGTLALALAASGCKSLGFSEEQKDLSQNTTKVDGKPIVPDPAKPDQKFVVKKFTLDLAAKPPKVDLVLKNEGSDQDLFLAEVEFGYPVPAGSVAPYAPDFRPVVWETFVKGEERAEAVLTSSLKTGETPLFARLIITTGATARSTSACEASGVHGLKRGTLFLGDRVEVVAMEGDYTSDEPWARFTLQNVDDKEPNKEIGNLRYTCQFFDREGKLIPLGKRFYALKSAPKPLGKKDDKVTIEVNPGKLEPGVSLVGAKPVLFVTVPKK